MEQKRGSLSFEIHYGQETIRCREFLHSDKSSGDCPGVRHFVVTSPYNSATLFRCLLFVCGILYHLANLSLSSFQLVCFAGQLTNELLPDCLKVKLFALVLRHRRGDRIY